MGEIVEIFGNRVLGGEMVEMLRTLHPSWHCVRYDKICAELRDIDWDIEFESLSAEHSFDKLFEVLDPLIQQYVPITASNKGRNHLLWKTRGKSPYYAHLSNN